MVNCQASTWKVPSVQHPSARETPSFKLQPGTKARRHVWSLEFLWMLGLEIWGFRSASLCQFDEVLQQLQSDLLAFLRMKLCGKNVVPPDRRGKVSAVIRRGGDNTWIRRLRIETVDEINVA